MNNHHTPGGSDLPMYPENASSDQIRWDIEKTKAEMDETIEALSCQLKPKQLLSDLTSAIKEKVTGRAADGTPTGSGSGLRVAGLVLGGTIGTKIGVKLVRHMACHPVSSALIGSGIAWMILESSEQTSIMRRLRMAGLKKGTNVPDPTNMYGQPAVGPACVTSQWKGAQAQSGQGIVEQIKEKAAGLGDKVSETVGGLGEKVSGLGGSIKNRITGLTSSEPQMGPGEPGTERHSTASQMGSPGGSRIKDLTGSAKDKLEDIKHKISEAAGSVKEKIGEVADGAREKIGRASHAAGESMHNVGSGVRSTTAGLTHHVRESAGHLRTNVRRGSAQVGDFIDENPLLAGGVIMGLGLLAGLLVPESEQERRLMGEKAQELQRKARESSRMLMDRGLELARTAAHDAADEAQKQILGADTLKGKAQDALRAAGQSIKDSVKQAVGTGASTGVGGMNVAAGSESAQEAQVEEPDAEFGGEGGLSRNTRL